MEAKTLTPIISSYNIDEEYLYSKTYLFIKGFATGRNFIYTLKALPLARKFHNGQYRKGLVVIDGEQVKLPYILHPLKVCSTLMSLNLPLTDRELDILYASALLHDIIEDASEYFPNEEEELETIYEFPEEVKKVVLLLSKKPGSTEFELNEYFNKLKKNKIALLIKLSDRSHNVETLYSFDYKGILKYIKETKQYFLSRDSICAYGKQKYPELSNGITILKSKILSLTESTEVILKKQEEILAEKDAEIKKLQEEIKKLKG